MVTDPIADFLTRIRNASTLKKEVVSMPYSRIRHAIADKLVQEKFLGSAEASGKKVQKTLEVSISYGSGARGISGIERVSKPGRRLYEKAANLRPYRGGIGVTFLSTPRGILTDREAKKENVGGEVLFRIW